MLLLDAGALIAVERLERDLLALLKGELRSGRAPRTHGGIVAQVWRGGSGRQARVAALLPALEVHPLDLALGKRTGLILNKARARDVVAAALVALASDGDEILTSDADDIAALARAAGIHVDVMPI